jgi:hypothetical protein
MKLGSWTITSAHTRYFTWTRATRQTAAPTRVRANIHCQLGATNRYASSNTKTYGGFVPPASEPYTWVMVFSGANVSSRCEHAPQRRRTILKLPRTASN